MKKVFVLAATLFASVILSAQNKGDKYIAGALNAVFGVYNSKEYDGAYTTTQTGPLSTSILPQSEFGYFIVNNLRLAVSIGVPINSKPTSWDGSTWLKANTIGFQINPSIAYYIRLAEHFYYTPELGVAYELGSYKEDVSASTTYNAHYYGWKIYTNILALEYQITDNLAIGIGIGCISYSDAFVKDKTSDTYFGNSQILFNLNTASTHIRWYF